MKRLIFKSKQNVKPNKSRMMCKRLIVLVTVVLLCLAGAFEVPAFAAGKRWNRGKHRGLLKMIEVDIHFNNSAGITVADSNGLTYYFGGQAYHDPSLIYSPEYYGTYPLYLPGSFVPIGLEITNLGPRSIDKLTLITEAYVINLDGSNGILVSGPTTNNIEVASGETKRIDASFMLPLIGKGLNRFTAKLYHHKNDNDDASLILIKEGIFCPPGKSLEDLEEASP